MVGSEELPYDETLPDFRWLELADDGSRAGYLDGLHGPLLEESMPPIQTPFATTPRVRQEPQAPNAALKPDYFPAFSSAAFLAAIFA